MRKVGWVVYAKRPFAGPEAVLAYLSRYTHRVAIANRHLIAFNDNGVTFTWKDYRAEGRDRHKVMTLATHEFIRRFLLHVLPDGFHRIRHSGLFANGQRREAIARARQLLDVAKPQSETAESAVTGLDPADANAPPTPAHPCPCCGGRMIVIETFERGLYPAIPAHGVGGRDRDRQLMILLTPSPRRSAARLPGRFPAGHGGARASKVHAGRSARRSAPLDADSAPKTGSFVHVGDVDRGALPQRPLPHDRGTALKSP